MAKSEKQKDDGKSFPYFFSVIFSRKLQEFAYFPEYSGMYPIHSIERSAPVFFFWELENEYSHQKGPSCVVPEGCLPMAFRKAQRIEEQQTDRGEKFKEIRKAYNALLDTKKASIWSMRGRESQNWCATASQQGKFLSGGALPPQGSVPFGYGSGGSGDSGFNWWEHWHFELSFSNGKWCRRWVFPQEKKLKNWYIQEYTTWTTFEQKFLKKTVTKKWKWPWWISTTKSSSISWWIQAYKQSKWPLAGKVATDPRGILLFYR